MKFLVFYLFLTTSVLANSFSASIVHINGKVEIHHQGEWYPLEMEDWVGTGDIIRTGKKSLLILRFPDKGIMRVQENTEVQIASLVERIKGESLGETSLILKSGHLLINVINKKKEPNMKVKTRHASLSVRGTKFFVGHDEHTWASVYEGEVHVEHLKNEDHQDALLPGHGMVIHEDKLTHPQKYNWVKDLNYEANKKHQHNSSSWKDEVDEKKIDWERDEEQWKEKKEKWDRYLAAYEKKMEDWKEERDAFIERRAEFESIRKQVKDKILKLRPLKQKLKQQHQHARDRLESLQQRLKQDPSLKAQLSKEIDKLKVEVNRLFDEKKEIGARIKELKKEKRSMQKSFSIEKSVRNKKKDRVQAITKKKKVLEQKRKNQN